MLTKYMKELPFNCDGSNKATVLLQKGNKVVIRLNMYEDENQREIIARVFKDVYGHDKSQYHLCGYVALPKKNIPTSWWGNYDADGLQYLSIHGGLTYAGVVGGYCIFGFDCAHAGDDDDPNMLDPEYVMILVDKMEEQLLSYKKIIRKWRNADTEKRLELLDEIRGTTTEQLGFGAMIDIMSGGEKVKNEKDDKMTSKW